MYSSTVSFTSALDVVCDQRHTQTALTREWPVPFVQEAGWTPGPIWRVRKISPPPIFDPRTVQPLASRYNDCGIPVMHQATLINLLKPTGYVMHQQV